MAEKKSEQFFGHFEQITTVTAELKDGYRWDISKFFFGLFIFSVPFGWLLLIKQRK